MRNLYQSVIPRALATQYHTLMLNHAHKLDVLPVYAEVPLLKDRDFLYREVTQKLPNGVIVIYGESLSPEEAASVQGVPSLKGVIRGDMGASGWVIAPVDGGANSSVTYVALTDLKVPSHA